MAWDVQVAAGWHEFDTVSLSLNQHCHQSLPDMETLQNGLSIHGLLPLDLETSEGIEVRAAYAQFLTGQFHDPYPLLYGRTINSGLDAFFALEGLAGDLEPIASAIFGDSDETWSSELVETMDLVLASNFLIMRSVRVAPVLWGHRIGGWIAARGITVLARDGLHVIAMLSAPLEPKDAGINPALGRTELDSQEIALWRQRQSALRELWCTSLGVVPMREHPNVLIGTNEDGVTQRINTLSW